jgi:hypothetical protein
MRRKAMSAVAALALVALGWMAGMAQTGPNFEFIVDAPVGHTSIECVKGCKLLWVERGIVGTPQRIFQFSCGGPNQDRCSSARVGGWIDR